MNKPQKPSKEKTEEILANEFFRATLQALFKNKRTNMNTRLMMHQIFMKAFLHEKVAQRVQKINKIKKFSEPIWAQISSFFRKRSKKFHIKILDIKYLSDFEHLNFRYVTYEVVAQNEKEAVKKARTLYMSGQKEAFSEELPFLFKIFSATECA